MQIVERAVAADRGLAALRAARSGSAKTGAVSGGRKEAGRDRVAGDAVGATSASAIARVSWTMPPFAAP